MSIKVGDKFIIEIGTIAELPNGKKKYFINPFESLVFDRKALEQLEPVEKAWESELEKAKLVAYKDGFEHGKLWAMDETKSYQRYYDRGYNKGLEDGKADAIYNTDLIDELKQVEYIRGLEDAKTYIVKLYSYGMVEMENEFDETTIPDIITNNPMTDIIATIDAYEERKKAEEEIKVGDEVIITGLKDIETIGIITMLANNNYTVICLINGSEMARVTKNDIKPTGRHFEEIEHLLSELKESEA